MRKHNNFNPAIYTTYFGDLSKIANNNGYALALHGSLLNDMDLIAVPWVENPSTHKKLITEIVNLIKTSHEVKHILKTSGKKPHGRISYTIMLGGKHEYIDLSITPTKL